MINARVIPSLLLIDEKVVKTRRFKSPSYVGDPVNAVKIFNTKEVDEIIILDIGASKKQKKLNFNLISRIATECFMPMCYGGGIATLDDASRIFGLGVEKISIQNAALTDLKLIEEIAAKYGSSSVVVSLDIKKNWYGKYVLHNSATRENVRAQWETFAVDAVNAGAGELLVTSTDRDGDMSGLDLEIIAKLASIVDVPVIANGGVGSLEDIADGFKAGASAVAAGSFFIYYGPHRAVLISYPKHEELQKLINCKS